MLTNIKIAYLVKNNHSLLNYPKLVKMNLHKYVAKCENRGVNLGKNDTKCYICKPKTPGCTDMEVNKAFNIFDPRFTPHFVHTSYMFAENKFVQIPFFVQLEF